MAFLAYRRDTIFKRTGQNILAQPSATIFVCKNGGVASSSSTGATITMAAGHGFIVGDKALVNPGASQYYDGALAHRVASFTRTTVTMTGWAHSISVGDVIFNLGADTATGSTPNYNSGKAIYSDRAGNTAIASFQVSTNADGEYEYSHYGGAAWEIVLVSGSVVDRFIQAEQQLILREPAPFTVGFGNGGTAAEAIACVQSATTPLQIWGAATDYPIFSVKPFAPTDTYPIVVRVGSRGNSTGDSRTLVYASDIIDAGGALESQAIYGANIYTGTATSTQMGVFGLAQSQPGSGKTQGAVLGLQGWVYHNPPSDLGTTTNLWGMSGTAAVSQGGTVSNAYGAKGRALLYSTSNAAVNVAYGVYGAIEQSGTFAGTLVTGSGGRFDLSPLGTNKMSLLLHGGGTGNPTLGFENGAAFKYLSYDKSNGYFNFDGDVNIHAASGGDGDLFVEDDIEAGGYVKAGSILWLTGTTTGAEIGGGTDANTQLLKVLNGQATPPLLSYFAPVAGTSGTVAAGGTHTGSANAAVLTDSAASFATNSLVGALLTNVTDGSHTTVTANTATTITGVLGSGSENDWDVGDVYTITNSPSLVVSSAAYSVNGFVGYRVYNNTDGSSGIITSNTSKNVVATLTGGSDNDWDTSDTFTISKDRYVEWGPSGARMFTRVVGQVAVSGDNGGFVSAVSFTNTTGTVINTASSVVKTSAALLQDGWIKIYIGTTPAFVPYWLSR